MPEHKHKWVVIVEEGVVHAVCGCGEELDGEEIEEWLNIRDLSNRRETVEIDINVICPRCGLVMVRYHDLEYVTCEYKGCANHGIRYELPKITLKEKG